MIIIYPVLLCQMVTQGYESGEWANVAVKIM